MLKGILAGVVLCLASMSSAFAVSVNQGNLDALRSIKGIGPATAASIISERESNGQFQSAEDLAKRVRGIGNKLAERFVAEGMTFD